MPYVLGIDVGSTTTVAAVSRIRGGTWSRPEVVTLDPPTAAVSSTLSLSPNGSLTIGDPAPGDPTLGGDPALGGGERGQTIRDFVRRVGDDVPVLVAGESSPAQVLTAVLVAWVVERVTDREGEHPRSIVLAHPASWGPYRRDLLYRALCDIGLRDVTLLPRPVTVAEGHAARGFAGATAAVYTLGGTGFEASLIRIARHGGFETFGLPQSLEQVAGADFDESLADHVRTVLGPELRGATGPERRAALANLRSECARAKCDLTVATETDVVVRLPSGPARVPVTRVQFEELIRPAIEATVDSLDRVIRSAGLTPADLDGVLLAGGSTRIPLVTELLAARFPGPVEVQADPQVTAATGAAIAGCQIAAPTARQPRPVAAAAPAGNRGRYPDDPVRCPDPYRADPVRYPDLGDPPPRPPVRVAPLTLPKASRLAGVRVRGHEG